VVGVNTPYFPRSPMPPIALFRAALGENHYIVHFQRPGVADAALARDVDRVFTKLVRRGVPLSEVEARLAARGRMPNLVELIEDPESLGEPLLSEEERAVYVDAFTRTGFTGGINWYRNMDRNWETTPQLDGARITVPSLMVLAEWDAALRPEMASAMPSLVDDLEMVTIARCGHWTQQEHPEELNGIMVDWLRRRFGTAQ
jgi:pimeloyl-ACP methyl ester carboxylesterase